MVELPSSDRGAWIDGRWRLFADDLFDVWNPATGELVGHASASGPVAVDAAVASASHAARGWRDTKLPDRIAALEILVAVLRDHGASLAELISTEMGTPSRIAGHCHVGWPIGAIEASIATATEALEDIPLVNGVVEHVPYGVAACIVPWNFPIHQAVQKVAPALLSGCTVVLKPSELAPLAVLRFVELAAARGFPPGVLNVVPGDGRTGSELVSHPGVGVISFTGSTGTGREIASAAGHRLVPFIGELGGKSPSLVLDRHVLDHAVRDAVSSCMYNSGQVCTAVTRLVVPEALVDAAVEIALEALNEEVVGPPSEPTTTIGPVASARQRDRILDLLRPAEADADVTFFRSSIDVPNEGAYVAPALAVARSATASVVTEEIFGPILTLQPYAGDHERGLEVVNASSYGLVAKVWSSDPSLAIETARRIDAGQVFVGDAMFDNSAPFGGFKASGVGREHGSWGTREFTQTRTLLWSSRS